MTNVVSPPQPPPPGRRFRLAGVSALAYSAVIIYASLQPFSGWRVPIEPFGDFLLAPWPRWVTMEDVLFNLCAYAPLGFLVSLSSRRRFTTLSAVVLATLLCSLLSLSLESIQQYLSIRIASNVDLLVNSFGGAVGALIAPLFGPHQRLGNALSSIRQQLSLSGVRGDAVLVLACLWLLTQLHTPAMAFGNGDFRTSLQTSPFFDFSPSAYLYAETVVVTLSITSLGLLLSSVTMVNAYYWRLLGSLVIGGLLLKTFSAWLIPRSDDIWVWLTPGVFMGLLCASALLWWLNQFSSSIRATLALLTIGAALAFINGVPINPYRQTLPFVLLSRSSHILSISNIVRALSDLWPWLALICAAFNLALNPIGCDHHPNKTPKQ